MMVVFGQNLRSWHGVFMVKLNIVCELRYICYILMLDLNFPAPGVVVLDLVHLYM